MRHEWEADRRATAACAGSPTWSRACARTSTRVETRDGGRRALRRAAAGASAPGRRRRPRRAHLRRPARRARRDRRRAARAPGGGPAGGGSSSSRRPGVAWTLPLYELALLTAPARADRTGAALDVEVVTREDAPLGVFGAAASAEVARRLADAGVRVRTAAFATEVGRRRRLARARGSARGRPRRRAAAPRAARACAGLPCDERRLRARRPLRPRPRRRRRLGGGRHDDAAAQAGRARGAAGRRRGRRHRRARRRRRSTCGALRAARSRACCSRAATRSTSSGARPRRPPRRAARGLPLVAGAQGRRPPRRALPRVAHMSSARACSSRAAASPGSRPCSRSRQAARAVAPELLAPGRHFVYRPLAVLEPFADEPPVLRIPLAEFGARSRRAGASATRSRACSRTSGAVMTAEGDRLALRRARRRAGRAPARGRPGRAHLPRARRTPAACATSCGSPASGGRAGWPSSSRAGTTWSLPLYELALQTAAAVARRGAGSRSSRPSPRRWPPSASGPRSRWRRCWPSAASRSALATRRREVAGGAAADRRAASCPSDAVVALARLERPAPAGAAVGSARLRPGRRARAPCSASMACARSATWPRPGPKQGGLAAQQAGGGRGGDRGARGGRAAPAPRAARAPRRAGDGRGHALPPPRARRRLRGVLGAAVVAAGEARRRAPRAPPRGAASRPRVTARRSVPGPPQTRCGGLRNRWPRAADPRPMVGGMDIVIAGGGVAGLEALLALGALAGDRARLTLVAPDPRLHLQAARRRRAVRARPPACASRSSASPPTPARSSSRTRSSRVDDAAGEVRLGEPAQTLRYDALARSPRARAPSTASRRHDVAPRRRSGGLRRPAARPRGGLRAPARDRRPARRDVAAAGLRARADDRGRGRRHGPAGRGDGRDAGARAARAVRPARRPPPWRRSCGAAGVALRTGVAATVEDGALVLAPGRRADRGRPAATPCRGCSARRSRACPPTSEGFVLAGDDARVEGCERTWAAGDGVRSPLKFGGLATHQARRAVAGIAEALGPRPGARTRASRSSTAACSPARAAAACAAGATATPPRCGGRRARSPGSTCRAGWPSTALAPQAPPRPATPGGGVEVDRTLAAMRAVEARYVRELARAAEPLSPRSARGRARSGRARRASSAASCAGCARGATRPCAR